MHNNEMKISVNKERKKKGSRRDNWWIRHWCFLDEFPRKTIFPYSTFLLSHENIDGNTLPNLRNIYKYISQPITLPPFNINTDLWTDLYMNFMYKTTG